MSLPDDPPVPTPAHPAAPDDPAAHARLQAVFRQRRLIAGTAVVAVFALIGGLAALLLGGGRTDQAAKVRAPRRRPAPVQAPAPSTPLVAPTLGQREAAAIEATRARMPLVALAGRRRREIALTFDDGPGPYTTGVLRELEARKVPATFFQVGSEVRVFTAAERALLRSRRVILGDHTEQHRALPSLARGDQVHELDDAASAITGAGGDQPLLFRPPYGAFNHTTLDLLARRRMLMVLWTIDSQDYERPGVRAIVRRVLDQARPGAIVLMHDAGGDRTQTIAALPAIIAGLRAKHYSLVSVPRLLHDNPPPLRQPPIKAGVG